MRCIFWWEWVIPSALCACGAFLTISFRCAYKIYSLSNQWFSSHPTWHKTKTDLLGRFLFWWEWVDSNHLRLKPTDLQSAPALQLRRTPNLGAGSGNRTRISSLEGLHTSLCTMPATNQSLVIIY